MSMIQDDPLNIVIAGVGGQGNVLCARFLGRALMKQGCFVSIVDSFGSTQRGGSVHSSIRAGRAKHIETVIPKGLAHVIVSLEPLETLRMLEAYGNPGILTLTNSQPVMPPEVLAGKQEYPPIQELLEAVTGLSQKACFLDAAGIASEAGAPLSANIVMLGALMKTALIPVESQEIEKEIDLYFSGSTAQGNIRAFRSGMKAFDRFS